MLADAFGREVSGVRVSLTDRCNFDCVYCHNEGLGDTRGPRAPDDEEISADRVVRFLEVAREFGVGRAKITGGEPMLRTDVAEIVKRAPDGLELSMTTNGTFLPGRAEALADAGLARVNVSQDAADPDEFAALTESGAYDRVLDGVDAAVEAGLAPVKLNMVVFERTAGYVPEMVDRVAENDGLRLQLIEYMPEIAGHPEWRIDIERVHDWLADQADEIERREMHARRRYHVDGGLVEVVDPVGNEEFCANCGRVRVTHDGRLKGCLNRPSTTGLGETKAEMRAAFRETVDERVPYYGEYLVRTGEEDGDGSEWTVNPEYADSA
jgi:cyclic pyranopterin phosphate synthase